MNVMLDILATVWRLIGRFRLVLTVVILASLLVAVYCVWNPNRLLAPLAMGQLGASRWGVRGAVLIAVCFFLSTVTTLPPASVVAACAGFVYGPVFGCILSATSLLVAAVVPFLLARHGVGDSIAGWVQRWGSVRRVNAMITGGGWKAVGILRLSGILPFGPLSYVVGLSDVRMRDYVIGNLGVIPSVSLYVIGGSLGGDLGKLATDAGRAAWISTVWVVIAGGVCVAACAVYLRGRVGPPSTRGR